MSAKETGSRTVAEAIDALRRGWPVSVGSLSLLAIETARIDTLAAFDPDARAPILIAPARAATLKLVNQIDAADPASAVMIERAPWIDLDGARAIADPATDLATPLKGPFHTLAQVDRTSAGAALELARLAGILPAFFRRRRPARGAACRSGRDHGVRIA